MANLQIKILTIVIIIITILGAYVTISIAIEENVDTGNLIVNVIDRDTGVVIEGIEITLVDEYENFVGSATTNARGIAEFTELDVGIYYMYETATNENYILLEEKYEITIESDKTVNILISNKRKTGNLQISAVDKDDNSLNLTGVEFDLYLEGSMVGSYTTDENGEIYIEELRVGNYTIIETCTNEWYSLADEVEFEITWNETTEILIENELIKEYAKVSVIDSEDSSIKVEGVTFEVLDEKEEILETITTDSEGEASTSKYVVKEYDTIYLQEIETNENYVLNSEIIEVELNTDSSAEVTIKSQKIKGQIEIIKTASADNQITGDKEGDPIEGTKFEIYDADNNLVETLTTNEKGIAITSLLEKGEYTIKEIETNEWYYLSEEIFTAVIEKEGQITELNITNDPKNVEIDIEESGEDNVEADSEIEYDISLKNSGNTPLDNVTFLYVVPTDYIKIIRFQTGTYNQDLQYDLYYKSNFTGSDYILLMEGLSTTNNYDIDFSFELADNEYVTEIKMFFSTIDSGFCSNENPHVTSTVNDSSKSGDVYENTVIVSGSYNGYEVTDTSTWKTIIYKILPKTGF